MGNREWGVTGRDEEYWFNKRTGEVETGPQSLSMDRVGPFASRAEAERADEIVAERARRWAEEEAAEE